jgi:hypothetical protein
VPLRKNVVKIVQSGFTDVISMQIHKEERLDLTTSNVNATSEYHMTLMYRVIHKSLRDFRPLQYSSRDGHAKGEYVKRGRDIPSFRPTLQVLDMPTFGDAADVNHVIKFLPHTISHVTYGGTCVSAPISRDLPQLRRRIVEAVAAINRHMLQIVWQELDYKIDICHVTKGGRIQHL